MSSFKKEYLESVSRHMILKDWSGSLQLAILQTTIRCQKVRPFLVEYLLGLGIRNFIFESDLPIHLKERIEAYSATYTIDSSEDSRGYGAHFYISSQGAEDNKDNNDKITPKPISSSDLISHYHLNDSKAQFIVCYNVSSTRNIETIEPNESLYHPKISPFTLSLRVIEKIICDIRLHKESILPLSRS